MNYSPSVRPALSPGLALSALGVSAASDDAWRSLKVSWARIASLRVATTSDRVPLRVSTIDEDPLKCNADLYPYGGRIASPSAWEESR